MPRSGAEAQPASASMPNTIFAIMPAGPAANVAAYSLGILGGVAPIGKQTAADPADVGSREHDFCDLLRQGAEDLVESVPANGDRRHSVQRPLSARWGWLHERSAVSRALEDHVDRDLVFLAVLGRRQQRRGQVLVGRGVAAPGGGARHGVGAHDVARP